MVRPFAVADEEETFDPWSTTKNTVSANTIYKINIYFLDPELRESRRCVASILIRYVL